MHHQALTASCFIIVYKPRQTTVYEKGTFDVELFGVFYANTLGLTVPLVKLVDCIVLQEEIRRMSFSSSSGLCNGALLAAILISCLSAYTPG